MNEFEFNVTAKCSATGQIMVRGVPWTLETDVEKLPVHGPTEWHGYVYALEFGDGIKIGFSTQLKSRIKSLRRSAAKYGDKETGVVLYSPSHTNYRENERQLHKFFAPQQIKSSERFGITLAEFVSSSPGLEFKDESEQNSRRADAFIGWITRFAQTGRLE